MFPLRIFDPLPLEASKSAAADNWSDLSVGKIPASPSDRQILHSRKIQNRWADGRWPNQSANWPSIPRYTVARPTVYKSIVQYYCEKETTQESYVVVWCILSVSTRISRRSLDMVRQRWQVYQMVFKLANTWSRHIYRNTTIMKPLIRLIHLKSAEIQCGCNRKVS